MPTPVRAPSPRRVAVAAALLLLSMPGAAQRPETDVEHDVRLFYGAAADRTVWSDERGRPSQDARWMVDRLRDAAEEGLDPSDYRAEELARRSALLDATDAVSAAEAEEFDATLTASVLRYFREMHLGRVNPRAVGFHLDHALEPHDFPERLRAALSSRSLDRVIAELRPAWVQYRALKDSLKTYRDRDPARARQIELAMERLRWLPDATGQRLLVVNIPMFYLWGWEADRADGVPVIGMAAITGRAMSSRTPVFASRIASVVFNPDWTVPQSIIRGEILPALAANPDYLAQHHMEMTNQGGKTRVRQLPGPWNALGTVKFVLPNDYSVYLHGTPAQSLFKRERRDFSHGCVRVADPLALAAWALQGEHEWPVDRIRSVIAAGRTRRVAINRPPHVVLFYMTAAFVPEDGSVRFADDVYGHDKRLEAALGGEEEGVPR